MTLTEHASWRVVEALIADGRSLRPEKLEIEKASNNVVYLLLIARNNAEIDNSLITSLFL